MLACACTRDELDNTLAASIPFPAEAPVRGRRKTQHASLGAARSAALFGLSRNLRWNALLAAHVHVLHMQFSEHFVHFAIRM